MENGDKVLLDTDRSLSNPKINCRESDQRDGLYRVFTFTRESGNREVARDEILFRTLAKS